MSLLLGGAAMRKSTSHVKYLRADWRTIVFVSMLLAIALLIALATTFTLSRSRIDTFKRADTASASVLMAISKDLERTIAFYDVSLRWAVNALATPGFEEASGSVRRQMLFASDLKAQVLGGVLIASANGATLYESGAPQPRIADIADKPYFKALRDDPTLGLVLSPPFQTVISNGESIALARHILDDQGRFNGVAVSTIRLSYLHDLIATGAVGSADVVTLLNNDGILLAREPRIENMIRQDLSAHPPWQQVPAAHSGSIDLPTPLDGIARHYRFIRVGDLPLVLLVGSPVSAIYADWRRQALAIGGVTGLTIALLLGLAWALHLELARRRRAELVATDGAEQFRLLAENVSDIIVRLDLDGIRRYVSPSALDVLGFTPQELLGTRWRDIVLPADQPIVDDALTKLLSGVDQLTVAYRCLKKAGAEIWVEARIRLVRDPVSGVPQDMIALARDVTASHRSAQELTRLAKTDGLTGLANRRAFDEALDMEWRLAMRSGTPVALLLIDVDHFKLYNDRYGHPAGDAALRMVGGCIAARVRRTADLAARYGGEEFVMLLPGAELAGALAVAEWICHDVAGHAIPHESSPFRHVTISIGVASRLVMLDDEPEMLIRDADQALYEAKRTGRNRVVQAVPIQEVVG
jgi:diguanylate cyclase (GGDEF)-like protein/PAS domain S-box-containing protein